MLISIPVNSWGCLGGGSWGRVGEHAHIVMHPPLCQPWWNCALERYLVKIYQHRGSGGSLEETMSCFLTYNPKIFTISTPICIFPEVSLEAPSVLRSAWSSDARRWGWGLSFSDRKNDKTSLFLLHKHTNTWKKHFLYHTWNKQQPFSHSQRGMSLKKGYVSL